MSFYRTYERNDGPLHLRPPNKRARVTIPEKASPVVKLFFAEMGRQGRTYDEMESVSGVRRAAMKAWRHKNRPSLESLEAVFSSLGYQFVPVPALEILPPALASAVATLAAQAKIETPNVWAALLEYAAGQRLHRMKAVERLKLLDEFKRRVKHGGQPNRSAEDGAVSEHDYSRAHFGRGRTEILKVSKARRPSVALH